MCDIPPSLIYCDASRVNVTSPQVLSCSLASVTNEAAFVRHSSQKMRHADINYYENIYIGCSETGEDYAKPS